MKTNWVYSIIHSDLCCPEISTQIVSAVNCYLTHLKTFCKSVKKKKKQNKTKQKSRSNSSRSSRTWHDNISDQVFKIPFSSVSFSFSYLMHNNVQHKTFKTYVHLVVCLRQHKFPKFGHAQLFQLLTSEDRHHEIQVVVRSPDKGTVSICTKSTLVIGRETEGGGGYAFAWNKEDTE